MMIDTTRALRIGGIGGYLFHGPASLIAVLANGTIVVQSKRGSVHSFLHTGEPAPDEARSALWLENAPIRKTERFFARHSASRPTEIKLQQTKPVSSIGEIEVDIEGDKIVAVRLAS